MNEKKNLTTEETFDLAVQNQQKNNLQVAENLYKKILKTNPHHASAHNNLGLVFQVFGKFQKARSSYQKAIQIQPDYANAHNNLGIVFKELGEHQKAIGCYEKAIQIKPNYVNAHNNLGNVFRRLGELQTAIYCYEKAIQIQPNYPPAHNSLGLILLLLSDFQKGFDEYEWRKKLLKNFYKKKNIESLEWQGEDLTNKTILILSEQGLGDTIHYARYLYILRDKYSAKIIFSTREELIHLFSKSRFKVISDEEPLPKHDFHQFLCSLPKIFYKEKKTFPRQINYIPKDTKIVSKWRDKLTEIKGIKVGFNWQGSATYPGDRLRSIPLNYFERLFTIEKINFISLQKGFGIEQIKNFKYKDKLYDFSSEMDNGKNSFEDTIGIMQNLDLVISPDTSLPRLSATLGIKTWVLLSFIPDWTWFLKSTDSPWYENTKLYRQDEINKWDSVFNNVKKDLANLK